MQQTNSFDDDLSGAAWSDAVAAGAGAGSGSGSGLGPGAGAGAAAAWTADFGAPRRPAYDTFDGDGDSDSASAAYRDSARDSARDAGAGASSSRPRQPVITKSHQLSHITSIFTDAQKMAYVGLCYLEIHRRGEARLAAAAGGKHAQQSYHEWADRFMRMLYAFLDVSEAEQQMIANLALHGLIPSDLSRTLLDDAAKALERLQKLEQEQAWIAEQEAKWMAEDSSSSSSFTQSIPKQQQQQESNNVSDIRFTILSHLFILCICDGFYDSRSRSLLRAVARHLEIDWWSVAKLEDTISEQLRIQDSESNENESVVLESSIVKDRNKKDSQGRWLYMGLATLAGGAVIGVTAGLAAPLIASGITSALATFHVAGGVGAGVTAFMGGSTGIAIIASSGASIGGGMTGYKMHKRTKGILEFEFIGLEEALVSIRANKEKRDKLKQKRDKKAEKERKAIEAAAATTTVLFDTDDASFADGSDQKGGHNRGLSSTSLVVLEEASTAPPTLSSAVDKRMEALQVSNGIGHRRGSSSVSSVGSSPDNRPSRDLARDFSTPRELGREISAPILFSNTPPIANDERDGEGVGGGGGSGAGANTSESTPKANVLITIAGWVGSIDSRDDFTLPFSTLTPGVHGEQYALVWETQALIELGHAVRLLMAEVTSFLLQQGIQYFLLPVLMAGLTGPLWALKLTYMVDNPWGNGLTKAKKAGRILADTLLSRVQGNRPVTLVGFSLGARVIYYCLLELASRGESAFSIVEEAYLFGTPVMATTKEWKAISSVVSGRLVNGYITNDYILSMLYRASSAFLADVAGLNPVKGVDGIENYNLDSVLKGGHLEYRSAMPRILKHVGFSVDDEFFDDGEKEAEQARLDEEKEKERIKNDKERAKEEAARKKQEEYEERVRKRKEEDEARRAEAEAKRAEAVAKKLQAELAAKNAPPPKRSWFFGRSSTSSLSSSVGAGGSAGSVVEAVEELPFEIKEIKSTLPPLVVTLDGGGREMGSPDLSPFDADGSLI